MFLDPNSRAKQSVTDAACGHRKWVWAPPHGSRTQRTHLYNHHSKNKPARLWKVLESLDSGLKSQRARAAQHFVPNVFMSSRVGKLSNLEIGSNHGISFVSSFNCFPFNVILPMFLYIRQTIELEAITIFNSIHQEFHTMTLNLVIDLAQFKAFDISQGMNHVF